MSIVTPFSLRWGGLSIHFPAATGQSMPAKELAAICRVYRKNARKAPQVTLEAVIKEEGEPPDSSRGSFFRCQRNGWT